VFSSSALINIARPLSGRYFDGNKKARQIALFIIHLARQLIFCFEQLWRTLPLQSCGSSTIVTSPWLNVFTPGSSSCNATMKVSSYVTHCSHALE
jgi:hypothetical protein